MKNKKIIIIIVLIVVVLVIAGVVGACLILRNKKEESDNKFVNEEQNVIDDNEIPVDEEYDENELDENTVTEPTNESTEQKQDENKQETNTNNSSNNNDKANTAQSSNNTSNTNTNKTSSSKLETTTTTKTESKPTVIGRDSNRELTKTETKYGVVIKTYTTTTYDLYSDGSKKEVNKTTDTEYDQSGYKASTSELKSEATQLKSSNAGLINGVLGYVNEYRREANTNAVNGVTDRKDLVLDSNLTIAACARAMEMAYGNKFSHTRPNGSSCFSILSEMGISYVACGENIAYGQTSAKSVSTTWKNSSGHYANMIDASYGKIGIGVINFRGTYYWVQMFTN